MVFLVVCAFFLSCQFAFAVVVVVVLYVKSAYVCCVYRLAHFVFGFADVHEILCICAMCIWFSVVWCTLFFSAAAFFFFFIAFCYVHTMCIKYTTHTEPNRIEEKYMCMPVLSQRSLYKIMAASECIACSNRTYSSNSNENWKKSAKQNRKKREERTHIYEKSEGKKRANTEHTQKKHQRCTRNTQEKHEKRSKRKKRKQHSSHREFRHTHISSIYRRKNCVHVKG